MTEKITADEMFESLTGLEEIAIKQHFGATVTTLAEADPLQFLRALVFVAEARDSGSKHREVYQNVQGLPLRDIQSYFVEDEIEPMPEDPVTASGKDAETY